MTQIIETVDVDVDVSTAYNQWTQFETFPRFLSFVKSITQLDDQTLRWVVEIAGAQREFTAKVSEQHPDERVAWATVEGEAHHAGVVTFHRLSDNETRVTVQLDWEPEGVAEKIGALVGLDDHAVKKDLKNFKEFIESRGGETGAWRGDIS
ncbi:SRPBCC family protein [Microbacterium aurantiacum]|uniref:SRPBCC family protein n=1 Tax=Microbacterium aurantiacum TaxID=162393 RepID=UPI004035BED7